MQNPPTRGIFYRVPRYFPRFPRYLALPSNALPEAPPPLQAAEPPNTHAMAEPWHEMSKWGGRKIFRPYDHRLWEQDLIVNFCYG